MKTLTGIVCALASAIVWSSESNFEQIYKAMSPAEYGQHVSVLASDKFGGRAPASAGEKLTLDYITKHFKSQGIEPANNGSYLQAVPLAAIETLPEGKLSLGDAQFEFRNDFVVNTQRPQKRVSVSDSDVIFVGYGAVAPEYDWNDYQGVDVKGKTVVILVNDPGYATQDPKLFNGKSMTYYGRWTYKYEEAARQGAAAAIIVHETAPASYGWTVVENSWTGEKFSLPRNEKSEPIVDLEMWLSESATRKVIADAGFNFDELKDKAKRPGFKAVPLGIKADLSVVNTHSVSKSQNVIGTIPGSKYPDEHIIYMAHWDHLGMDKTKKGDQIYNGAMDNASGIAAMLVIADSYQKLSQRPERSITFVAVTAEEQGLLGSKYYAENPVIPINKSVAVINMDGVTNAGLKKDLSVVGFNKSTVQDYLEKAAARQNRILLEEVNPARGTFYRSDHFSLAKVGVPAVFARGGTMPLNEKEAEIDRVMKGFRKLCYHQVCDELSERWSLESAIADIQIYLETGWLLANTRDWPKWHPTAEFKR